MARRRETRPCAACGRPITRRASAFRSPWPACSPGCRVAVLRAHPERQRTRWQGGRWVHADGYVYRWVGRDHPLANARGYALEHRLVLLEAGHAVGPGERVVWLDGDRSNNDLANLLVVPARAR